MKFLMFLLIGLITYPDRVLVAEELPKGNSEQQIHGLIARYETQYKLPKGLLFAIVRQESSFQPDAINPKRKGVAISSFGLGQLTIDTAAQHCGLGPNDLFDIQKNLECSAKVLRYQMRRFHKPDLIISAYNDGTPCVCDGSIYRRYDNHKSCKARENKVLVEMACAAPGKIKNEQYVTEVTSKWQLYLPKKKVARVKKSPITAVL